MLKRKLFILLYILLSLSTATIAEVPKFNGGHAKYRFLMNTFPEDSLLHDVVDSPAIDHNGDLRLKFNWQTDKISLQTDYQLIAQHGDSIPLARNLPAGVIGHKQAPDDNNRLFDLTHIVSQDNNDRLSHRLDRLYINITGTNTVARIGRQAVSWGNGLIYNPMDFFNPFDPAAVDKEYKTGDDMVYGQYLQQSGNDLQAVWVVRRNELGNTASEVNSLAIKYHGFVADKEYDLLLAEHFDDMILGVGGITDLGGAIWRGDITLTDTEAKNVTSLVTSLSYSWTAWQHNVSGIIEYFYNGFGIADGNYSPAALASNPDLVARLIRGELFTLGRHYLAASLMIEMTPLWHLTPNVFINASDGSMLAQLATSYDLKQNWQLLAAISLPAGATGTEFGGIDSGINGKPLSSELHLFAQLAWYF